LFADWFRRRRNGDSGRLEDDEAHFVRRFVVQQQRQVVEGEDRAKVIGQPFEQLCRRLRREDARDRQQRVVA